MTQSHSLVIRYQVLSLIDHTTSVVVFSSQPMCLIWVMSVIVGSLLVHSVGSGYNRQQCGATYIGSNYQLSPKRACAQCTHFLTTDGLML